MTERYYKSAYNCPTGISKIKGIPVSIDTETDLIWRICIALALASFFAGVVIGLMIGLML